MILKEKEALSSGSIRLDAGIKHEQDVAFYLRRSYKDHKKVLVINDIKLVFDGETAQIDHLIIYPYGFVIIESKSIRGEVKVNAHGEWSRSFKGVWSGMPSPIKQAEMQIKILREILKDKTSDLLGKKLGVLQQGFGARQYDVLCAISSDAIIDRDSAPKGVASLLVKSEFVVDALDKIFNFKKAYQVIGKIADTRPDFSDEDMQRLGEFFANYNTHDENGGMDDKVSTVNNGTVEVICKHCGAVCSESPMPGRFGYYCKCSKCSGNTGLKDVKCPLCGSADTKAVKNKESYLLECHSCKEPSIIYRGG